MGPGYFYRHDTGTSRIPEQAFENHLAVSPSSYKSTHQDDGAAHAPRFAAPMQPQYSLWQGRMETVVSRALGPNSSSPHCSGALVDAAAAAAGANRPDMPPLASVTYGSPPPVTNLAIPQPRWSSPDLVPRNHLGLVPISGQRPTGPADLASPGWREPFPRLFVDQAAQECPSSSVGHGSGRRHSDDAAEKAKAEKKREIQEAAEIAAKKSAERGVSSKARFKQFHKELKEKEKEGDFEKTVEFGFSGLAALPKKLQHRVVLELADFAKRENKTKEARNFYRIVTSLQPNASQGWLEHAKLEEECGNLESCTRILEAGLEHCPDHEALLVKMLKHYERMEMPGAARQLLGRMKDEPLEKCWRIIMEGGLFEARQGNDVVARLVFRFLTTHVPWYGPTYQEACRFEEKCEQDHLALEFVERGLEANSRYGPLWFSALRLHEKIARDKAGDDGKSDLSEVHSTVKKATRSISKELQWKIYFEAAQIEDRAGNLEEARKFYVFAVSHCPQPLLWKVWMQGAKTELQHGNVPIARMLLKRALDEVPIKMRAMVLLDYSRLEEFAGKPDRARHILRDAKQHARQEWKVFLESILLEMRFDNAEAALVEARQALEVHSGTGRLWAIMIQLSQGAGLQEQLRVLKRALREVPKSGEVWCEGARIAMRHGDWAKARTYIQFAIQFTPQYGDSFIEFIRLELLEKGENADVSSVVRSCVNADPNYGTLWLHCKRHPLDSTRQVLRVALAALSDHSAGPVLDRLHVSRIYDGVQQRSKEEKLKAIFL